MFEGGYGDRSVGRANYEELPSYAKMIREDGKDLANTVISVYRAVEELRMHWHGKRYNDFASYFNNLIPGFREILTLCVQTIPVALEQIANNYAVVDTGSKICAVSDEVPATIPEIPPCGETDFRFMQDEIQNSRSTIMERFNILLDIMQKISTEITELPWKSDASEMFRTRFEELKGRVIKNIEETREEFENAISQASQDVSEVEAKNSMV